MKHTILAFCLLICLVFTWTDKSLAVDLLDEIMTKGVIIVATDPYYAPQSYLNVNGKLEGFDIEVAKEVAKRLRVGIRFVTPLWEHVSAGKWRKRWDVSIGSMTPTKERKKKLIFTKPYYGSLAQFAIHEDNESIRSLSDLAGKVIGVTGETTYERYLKRNLEIENVTISYQSWKPRKLEVYPTDLNHIENLALWKKSPLDAVFTSRQTLTNAIRTGCDNGCPLKILGDPPYYEPLCFALDKRRKNSQSLLKKLNAIIQSMIDDGSLVKFSMKFFKTNLIPKF